MDNRPKYCTIVDPSEYDIKSQMERMVRLANRNKEIYTPMDVGKTYGLYLAWQESQKRIAELEERVKRAEATIPWTAPGMEWFTLFWPGPEPRDRAPQRLFTCGEGGTMLVCTLGPEDYVFVGRGKKPNSAISGGE